MLGACPLVAVIRLRRDCSRSVLFLDFGAQRWAGFPRRFRGRGARYFLCHITQNSNCRAIHGKCGEFLAILLANMKNTTRKFTALGTAHPFVGRLTNQYDIINIILSINSCRSNWAISISPLNTSRVIRFLSSSGVFSHWEMIKVMIVFLKQGITKNQMAQVVNPVGFRLFVASSLFGIPVNLTRLVS